MAATERTTVQSAAHTVTCGKSQVEQVEQNWSTGSASSRRIPDLRLALLPNQNQSPSSPIRLGPSSSLAPLHSPFHFSPLPYYSFPLFLPSLSSVALIGRSAVYAYRSSYLHEVLRCAMMCN